MRHFHLPFLKMLFILSCCFGCLSAQEQPLSHYVLVSVAPHQFFVEKIAGNTVKIGLLVPAGASAHTFEPTPKQMMTAAQADLWFQIGESFEPRALASMQRHRPQMEAVDLRQGLDLIYACHSDHSCCHCSGGADLHFWLSPRLAKQQARTIAEALIRTYPENRDVYQSGLQTFLQELDALDIEIQNTLRPLQNRTIFVSHPAYAYFCRDYDLTQFSIEFEGKDPTPQQLTRLLQMARQKKIRNIYAQIQYNTKGAQLVAQELGAQLIILDPYSQNYMETLREIAAKFATN